jgi:hypothetical protein
MNRFAFTNLLTKANPEGEADAGATQPGVPPPSVSAPGGALSKKSYPRLFTIHSFLRREDEN